MIRTRLLWLAPTTTAVIAVVSAMLLDAIDALFARAVREGRVFPFTGEADEQAIDPGLVLIWSVLATLVTLVVVALITRQRQRSDLCRRWPMVVAVALALLVAGPIAFLAEEIATNKVSQQLYAAWYVPFLAVGTLAYAVFLLAGARPAHRHRSAREPDGWFALDPSGDVRHPFDVYRGSARVLELRRRPVVVWLAAAMIVAFVVLIGVVVSPYFKYVGGYERAAARHLDKVTVDGFGYLGEDASDNDAVSRYWVRRSNAGDLALAIRYDGRELRRDHPGRESLSRSRFEEEVGWLSLPDDEVPCALTAYKVREVDPGPGLDMSSQDERAIESGTMTLIRVVVVCGEG